MGLFDSDEEKRKRELERRTKIMEDQRKKKYDAKCRLLAEKKKEKRLERLREISQSYENESPFALAENDNSKGASNGAKNTPPMSLNRGLGSPLSSYNKSSFSASSEGDGGSSKGSTDQSFPKLNRW